MSSLVLGAVGAVAGFFVGGPAGAAVGFGLGAALGASLTKPPTLDAGKLGDLKASPASYGATIPYIKGVMRVPGVIVWNSEKRETKTTTSQGGGKGGGPSVETTTYTYSMDVLLLLSAGEIVGVRRVWSAGKLIWTVHADSSDADVTASSDGTHWDRMTVYTGASDQTPDATYEAAVGTADAIAYRGRGSVFIENLQLGGSGQMPQLTFEVFTSGTAVGGLGSNSVTEDFSTWSTGYTPAAWSGLPHPWGGTLTLFTTGAGTFGTYLRIPTGDNSVYEGAVRSVSFTAGIGIQTIEFYFRIPTSGSSNLDDAGQLYFRKSGSETTNYTGLIPRREAFYDPDQTPWFSCTKVGLSGAMTYASAALKKCALDTWYKCKFEYDKSTGTGSAWIWDASKEGNYTTSNWDWYKSATNAGAIGSALDDLNLLTFTNDQRASCPPCDYANIAANGYLLDRAQVDLVSLSSVVLDQCVRAGISPADVDVTDLSSTDVRGFAVTQVTPARSVLEMLAAAYHFDCYESGGVLTFRMRGDDPAITLDWDDLGASENGDAEALQLTRVNDVEIPTQFAVKFANASNDYQDGIENSDRLISANSLKVETMEYPLALTPTEARQIAEVRSNEVQMSNLIVENLSTDLAKGCQIEPSDTIVVVDQDATQYTLKVQKVTRAGLAVQLECSLEDVTAVVGTAVTDTNYVDSTTVLAKSGSTLYVLDIPLLRDADDGYNHYYAVGRTDTTGTWIGAAISRGASVAALVDVDSLYSYTYTGTTLGALGNFTGGTVFDESNALIVSGVGTLESWTRDEILNGTADALLVGDEVIFYTTATPYESPTVSPSTTGGYILTGLLRGRRGTEWAISGHASGEDVVLLKATAGMKLYDGGAVSDIDVPYVWGSVTLGTSETVATQSFTNTGIIQKPFAPVDARAEVDSGSSPNTITLTWKRRTRYAVQWTGSTGSVVPLGEDSESYEIDLNDPGSPSGASETQTASSPTLTLDASYSGWTATIYQISAQHGRGYGVSILLP